METISHQQIIQMVRRYSLNIQRDAVDAIERHLVREPNPKESFDIILNGLLDYLQQNGGSQMIDLKAVMEVLAIATRDDDDVRAESFEVISALNTPKYVYDPSTLNYIYKGRKFPLHADISAKFSMHEERLNLIHARLLRNPAFQAPLLGSKREYIHLTRVGDLSVTSQQTGVPVSLLGVLTQPEEGLFCLEDVTGVVALDLSSIVEQHPGFFTEFSVVLVEGQYDPDGQPQGRSISSGASEMSVDQETLTGSSTRVGTEGRISGVLRVTLLTHPPAESREQTLRAMHLLDALGTVTSASDAHALRALEEAPGQRGADASLLLLSEVHLDDSATFVRLRRLLRGFQEAGISPCMIVLCGSFSRVADGAPLSSSALMGASTASLHASSSSSVEEPALRQGFFKLGVLFAEFASVTGSAHVVLVPGELDGLAPAVLPRLPLPQSLYRPLLEGFQHGLGLSLSSDSAVRLKVTASTSPCRLRIFSRELVIHRDNLSLKLLRAAVISPTHSSAASPAGGLTLHSHRHLAVTLLGQSALTALAPAIQPVYWSQDHALRFHALPDAIVIAEDESQWSWGTQDVQDSRETDKKDENSADGVRFPIFNPGVFSEGRFALFWPCKNVLEHSCVDDEELSGEITEENANSEVQSTSLASNSRSDAEVEVTTEPEPSEPLHDQEGSTDDLKNKISSITANEEYDEAASDSYSDIVQSTQSQDIGTAVVEEGLQKEQRNEDLTWNDASLITGEGHMDY